MDPFSRLHWIWLGYVTHQTRQTVFHRDVQTPRRELKIRRAAEYFDEIRGIWIADETLRLIYLLK